MTDYLPLIIFLLTVLLAFLIGYQVGVNRRQPEEAGYFILNYDNPNKEFMTLRLDKDLPEILDSSYISFEVIIQGNPNSDLENSPGENLT